MSNRHKTLEELCIGQRIGGGHILPQASAKGRREQVDPSAMVLATIAAMSTMTPYAPASRRDALPRDRIEEARQIEFGDFHELLR